MEIRYTAANPALTTELEKYMQSKLARISRRVPRKARAAAVCEVVLKQVVIRGTKIGTCSITLTMGDEQLMAKETTQHMHAAVDIAAVQIERQLRDYVRRQRGGLLKRRPRSE